MSDIQLLPDNQIQAIQSAVEDVGKRDVIHKMLSDLLVNIEDKVFEDRSIYIDGYRFINCSFQKCKLFVLRGTFEFHHCIIRGGITYYDAEALKSIQLGSMHPPKLGDESGFRAKTYPDGSLSIAKGVSIE